MAIGMAECRRCKKPIHHNYFPKLVLTVKGTVLFSHNPYNYLEDRYVLCTRCKNAFYRFLDEERNDNE